MTKFLRKLGFYMCFLVPLQVPITAVLAQTEYTVVTSLSLTTERVCTRASKCQAPTLRSCQPSGSSRYFYERIMIIMEITLSLV